MTLARLALASLFAVLALCLLPIAATATIPNTIISSGPTGTIASTEVTFTFRADAGSDGSDPASFQCRLDSSSASSWQRCTSPISYDGLAEGAHTFEVRTKNGTGDGVGSVDPTPALAAFTIAVPPQTTIDSGPSGPTASNAAVFAFSSSEAGTFQCRLDSSSSEEWSACSSPASLTGLSEGAHAFEVRAIDGTGNADPTPASASFSVDTVAPETTVDIGPTGTIDVADVELAFSSSEAGTFECRLDSVSDEDWSPCVSTTSLAGLAEGDHTFEVRAIDGVGNSDETPAVATFAVDTTAPNTEIEQSPTGTIDVTTATIEFSSPDETTASFECRLDSSSDADWAACASPTELSGLAEGDHRFDVRAVDPVGNADPTPASAAFSVDTVAPETAIEVAPAPKLEVSEASFVFSAPGAAGFECRIDSAAEEAWAPCTSPVVLTGLADGTHTFEVRAVDAVGNTDPTPAVVTFAVDIPVNGAKLAVAPLTGTVRIKTPDIKHFRPLTEGETIPVGSQVDTTEGKVRLVSANATGEQQQASFSQGIFGVAQKLGSGLVTLKLRGRIGSCAAAGRASSSARSGRRLWGSGKGQFRTTGSYGSATVRGTVWFTEDRCDGTYFEVTKGVVGIRDFPRRKTIALRAGESYLAQKSGS